MEGADQVLAVLGIDRGLAADRGIDLRQQRGRHLHVVETAAHHGGREAGEIPDHAAAERDHEIAALDARRDQRLADLLEHRKALGALARRHGHDRGADAAQRERSLRGREMMAGDRGVGDHRRLGARPQRRHAGAERGQRAAADHDLVAARTERDIHQNGFGCPHRDRHGTRSSTASGAPTSGVKRAASAPTISSTIFSCGTSRDWMVISACA